MTPTYTPTLDQVRQLAQQGNIIPIYRELPADLETPVSVYLKLCGQGRSNGTAPSFLLESVEKGRATGPVQLHRPASAPHHHGAGRPDHRRRRRRHGARDAPGRPARRRARAVGRPPAGARAGAAALQRRRGRLLRLRPGALHGAAARHRPAPARHSRPRPAGGGQHGGLRPRAPSHQGDRQHARRAGPARGLRRRRGPHRPDHRRPAQAADAARTPRVPGGRNLAEQLHPGRVRGAGAARQGIHRLRRHLPGGAQPTPHPAHRGRLVHDLPGAAHAQPVALHVLPELPGRGGHRGGAAAAHRLQPGDARAASRTATPTCTPLPAPAGAARPKRRTRSWPPTCWPTRRNWPSTSCWWTWGATTWVGSPSTARSPCRP